MVLSGFPRRSETFALNEIWALEQRGALAAHIRYKSRRVCCNAARRQSSSWPRAMC